jgi:hypothetical protein
MMTGISYVITPSKPGKMPKTGKREVILQMKYQTYYLRTELRGTCYDVLSAAGAAVPPRVRH